MLFIMRRTALSWAKRFGLFSKVMHYLCVDLLKVVLLPGQRTLTGWVTSKTPPKRRRHAEETPPRDSPRKTPD